MNELSPWSTSNDEADARAADLVAQVAQIGPAPVDLTQWSDIVSRVDQQRSTWKLAPAFAASVAVGVALVLWLKPQPAVVEPPVLLASSDAAVSQRPGGVVHLARGRVSIERATAARVLLQTPHLTVDASRARFLADVVGGSTVVAVQEGDVVVRAEGLERRLGAGERLVWPPSPVIPSPLTTAPTTAAICDEAGQGREACLEREAQGDGLDAQAALFELGRLQQSRATPDVAVATFRASLSRFPTGVLHPEVRLTLLVELTRLRRFDEAVQVANEFETACPTDPRLADVRALRRSLEPRLSP